MGMTPNEYSFLGGVDKNVLELIVVWLHHSVNILKTNEIHT